MKKQRALVLVLITMILFVCSAGCAFTTEEGADVFSQGLMFKNDEFGITMKIPDNWLQTEEEKDAYQEDAKRLGVNTSKIKKVNLLVLNKYPIKSGKVDNALVTWSVQNMGMYPGVKGEEFALSLKEKAEKNSQVGVVATKGPYNEKIDGIDFSVIEYKSTSRVSFLKVYVAIINGYAHTFGLTYTSPEDLNTCNEIIKSMTIRK